LCTARPDCRGLYFHKRLKDGEWTRSQRHPTLSLCCKLHLVLQQPIFIVAVQLAHSNLLSSHNLDIREALRSRPREALYRSGSSKPQSPGTLHKSTSTSTSTSLDRSQTLSFFSCFTIAKVDRDR